MSQSPASRGATVSENCPICDGFAWIPDGDTDAVAEHWYQKDWRLLLDSSVQWRRCPQCGNDQPFMKRLHIDLSKVLLQRIEQEVSDCADCGLWSTGILNNGMTICRWQDIACVLCDEQEDRWKIFSVMGVTDELSRAQCQFFLSQAGSPELPTL